MSGVASPCIGQCRLDDSGRSCSGCRRTLAEIAAWSSADDAFKQAVLARLAALPRVRALQCAACGQSFHCGSGAADGGCWCAELPATLPLPDDGSDCLCPRCLAARVAAASAKNNPGTGPGSGSCLS